MREESEGEKHLRPSVNIFLFGKTEDVVSLKPFKRPAHPHTQETEHDQPFHSISEDSGITFATLTCFSKLPGHAACTRIRLAPGAEPKTSASIATESHRSLQIYVQDIHCSFHLFFVSFFSFFFFPSPSLLTSYYG